MKHAQKIGLTFLCLMALTAFSAGAVAAADITFKLSHNAGPGQSIDLGTLRLAELVKERTKGRVEIKLFPNNVLGPEVATRDMLKAGTIDLLAVGSGILSNWSEATNLLLALYVVDNEDELKAIMNGEFGQKYLYDNYLQNQKIRLLDLWPASARQLLSKKPVRNATDLAGLKLRTPAGIPVWEAGWNLLGVMSLSLSLSETFTGLQQGVCDAVEMPPEFLKTYRFYEIAKYLTMTNHTCSAQALLISERSWNKLSAEDQQILQESGKESGLVADEVRKESDRKILAEFKESNIEIIELAPEVLADFKKKVEPVYIDFKKKPGNEQIYNDFIAARDKYRSKK